jgi:hypothetical protein
MTDPQPASHFLSLSTPPPNDTFPYASSSRLTIRTEPPLHLYSDEVFVLEYALEQQQPTIDSSSSSTTSNVSVLACLHPPTDQATLLVLDNTKNQLTCRISSTLLTSFQIHIRDANYSSVDIQPATTRAITLVHSKLQVETSSTSSDWSGIWYKDEGGRDKCMQVSVGLYNQQQELVPATIPLTLQLLYFSAFNVEVKVTCQEVLRVMGATQLENGTARVKFRIEDVSKNHQGQDFVVKLFAADDTAIAPAYTPSVSVRSKRNKRHHRGGGSSGRTSEPQTRANSPMMRPAIDHRVDTDALLDAVRGVSQWANDVVNSLMPLQWSVLGYAQHPDGSPDYNRPYHNMPNPNPTISRLLATYSESAKGQLGILERAVAPEGRVAADPYRMARGGPPTSLGPAHRMPTHPYDVNYDFAPYYPRSPPRPPPPLIRGTYSAVPTILPTPHYGRPLPKRPRSKSPLDHAIKPMVATKTETAILDDDMNNSNNTREHEVEYVLAKQYKSLRSGERLGFPAYSVKMEILGFYQEECRRFVPISLQPDFATLETRQQAANILQDAIATKSEAVYTLTEWGSIDNLLDHALVFDWSKDISGNNNSNNK